MSVWWVLLWDDTKLPIWVEYPGVDLEFERKMTIRYLVYRILTFC